ncbi:MAG: hypothetical protein NT159_05810 [Proteobacteria bacterium]|nr:hypothetical protein [Pseudomonadota bacterium]
MTDQTLTPEQLAIAHGTAVAELCREMILHLHDRIIAHASIVEAAGEYFSSVSAWELRDLAEVTLAKATRYAGGAVLSEKEVRNADATTH